MAARHTRGIVCIYTICMGAAAVLFVDTAMAANPGEPLGTDFMVRTLLGVALGVIAYYTRGLENKVRELDSKLQRLYENQQHEYREYQSSIGLLKETLYRDFPSKGELDPKFKIMYEELRHIHKRVDLLTRRRTDADDGIRHARRSTDEH